MCYRVTIIQKSIENFNSGFEFEFQFKEVELKRINITHFN